MSARIIDGKKVANALRKEISNEVRQLKEDGITPGLAVILVGEDPASLVYVRKKNEACKEVGIYSEEYHLPAEIKETDLLELIDRLNRNSRIHGILVQLPLPSHMDQNKVIQAILPEKDVDGFHEINMGRLLLGHAGLVPCTPLGIIHLLEYYNIPIEGRVAVVVGRSNIVGKPVSLMLLQRNATVIICHSRTKDLKGITSTGDILVVAAGRPNMITGDMIKEGSVIIDVGINRLENGKLTGDVDFESASRKAGWITPVPGGVGPMTVTMLLYNTVKAARFFKCPE